MTMPGSMRIGAPDREVVVCAMARSAFGRFDGALAGLSAAELGAQVLDRLLEKLPDGPGSIQAVYAGIGLAGAAVLTVTRQMLLRSGLPQEIPSMGVDRACCSGMTAVAQAARDIACGLQDIAIAGGVESLSNMPLMMPRRHGTRPGSVQLTDPLVLGGAIVDRPIAVYSGEESQRLGVDRGMQDQWACDSHARYFAAEERGAFAAEIVPVQVPVAGSRNGETRIVDVDEGPRRDSTLERLARLKTVYGSPTITAGNAPGLSDGAAFLVLATRRAAEARGWPVLGRVAAYTQVAGGPTSGTSTPALAIQRLLQTAGLPLSALARLEINEAYAATPLVSTQVLAQGDESLLAWLRQRTNPWGGAVAIGHPLGASGARLIMTLLAGLAGHAGAGAESHAAAAICGGFGQGDAILLAVP